MDKRAQIVRTMFRWSLRVLEDEEARHTSLPGPRLSQVQLGRLMARTDIETAIALAADIWDSYDGKTVAEVIAEIRSGWGEQPPVPRRRGVHGDLLRVASSVQYAVRRHADAREREMLETVARAGSFTGAARVLRRRDPKSLEADYERVALRIYRSEEKTICDASDFVVKLGKLRGVSK